MRTFLEAGRHRHFRSLGLSARALSLLAILLFTSACLRQTVRDDEAQTQVAELIEESTHPALQAPGCEPWRDAPADLILERVREQTHRGQPIGYAAARDHLFGRAEPWIDIDEEDHVTCAYTGRRARIDGTRTPEDMNTEHTWPRSQGSRDEPALSDLHHLFVTDRLANNRRSNYAFGTPDCELDPRYGCRWEEGGSRMGRAPSGNLVFEVRPQMRGDIARAQFYFAVRYGFSIPVETEDALRQWHASDPPDDAERRRNDAIEIVQGNRNPFIDCAQLTELIADF